MSKQIKLVLLLFEIAIAVLYSSCLSQVWNVLNTGSPPYAITKPVYRIAGPDDVCTIGGVFFDFYNKTEKQVIFIETCMNVFDKQTNKLAFSKAAGLRSGASCTIGNSQKKNLCIPLDGYLCQIDSNSLCVDNFFISKIEYDDGSVWQDKFGVYAATGGEEV